MAHERRDGLERGPEMAGGLRKKSTGPAFAVGDVSRKPQQGRSKASLERMLAAGRELMLDRGSEEFTLQEVSERGQVSIGSIYLRFESKDNLVRGVMLLVASVPVASRPE